MQIPLVDLKSQYKNIDKEINKKIKNILKSGSFIKGSILERFEKDFAKFIGVKHCIGVSSGTEAIHLCLLALGIGNGDEVILPVNTFIATAYAALYVSAKPIFIDVDEKTYNIDINDIESKITKRTKAIIPVHLYGQPADMQGIIKLAKKYKLTIIEDACQAHGAKYNGKVVGSLSNLAAFSFYPAKNLGAYGDAGAITTNSSRLAHKIKSLREYGAISKYKYKTLGLNSRLDSLQAAVLKIKLRYLDEWNSKRIKLADYYNKRLQNEVPFIITPSLQNNSTHIYHLYVIRAPRRNKLVQYLLSEKIQVGIHYPIPLHLQTALKSLGYKRGDFPKTELISNQILSLPIFPELTFVQQDFIINLIKKFYNLDYEN